MSNTVLVVAILAFLMTGFGNPGRYEVNETKVAVVEPSKAKVDAPRAALKARKMRASLSMSDLPSAGAMLAGALLAVPFVFSTYRTVRRGRTP